MSVQGGNIEKLLGKIADGIGDLKTNINQMNQDLKTKLDVLISRVDRK